MTHVIHVRRPELGTGEIGDVIRGQPPVIQVYWPRPDKYGFYLSTDLRRVDGTPAVDDTNAAAP